MECFSIDESGYTGFDLLNSDQRFQGASAISISDEMATSLIKEHFPRLMAPELKYRSLARRPANRDRLLNLQRDALRHYKCISYVCDKRYLLALMFMDYAVEPYYYERGIDFYEDGNNYSLASLLYRVGPGLLGKTAFENLMTAFQIAINTKSRGAINDLVVSVQRINWQALPEALGPLALGAPECLEAIATPGLTSDIAFIVLQSLISRTEIMAEGNYRVEHDRSTNLLKYHSLLEKFISHDQEIEFRQTKIASWKFPLKLSEVTQVDSKESPAVQIADVLIGAAVDAARSFVSQNKSLITLEDMINLYTDNQFIHMLPSLDFDEQKEFRRNTQASELIDYFGKHF